MEKQKKRFGDRKDGRLLRDLDGMHFITPLIYPNRCDNEAYISETIDLTNMNAYLERKNANETEFRYTMFHVIVAALIKTITLRPKMNRFIANKNFYQRNEVSMSFVVKKQFADEAAEALARQDDQQEPAAKPSAADNELLTLVNPWNPLPSDWEVDLVDLSNGSQIDRRCYDALQEMMDACRDAGYEPLICSAYRTQETQQELFDKKVAAFEAEGKSHDQAVQEAGTVVAVPGTSEHQLGLAVDLVDANMQDLTSAQESTETQKWLMANSWRYGFIHRYPNGKTDITGIIYEPWHYRYVGKDAAQEIFNRDITLEEYLGKTEH